MQTTGNQRFFAFQDAPDDVVTACRSEAHAVRICLAIAKQRGLDMQAVSLATGWKGKPACLSDIASDDSKRRMPDKKMDRFAKVTGCNLLRQYRARQEVLRQIAGKATQHDLDALAVQSCLAAWRHAA